MLALHPLAVGHFGGDSPELCHYHFQTSPPLVASAKLTEELLLPAELKEINASLLPEVQLLNHWAMRDKAPSLENVFQQRARGKLFHSGTNGQEESLCWAQLTG